jgi:hypothetical protein
MNSTFTDEDVPLIPLPADDAPPPTDLSTEMLILDGQKIRLFRTGGTAVRATITDLRIGSARTFLRVQIARAYPLSDPDHFIGLRDDKDKDVGMLESLAPLDEESRKIALEELDRRYFLPRIVRVKNVKDEFGTITWDVVTDRGDRTFFLQNLKESYIDLPPHRLIVTDRDGSRWEFPDTRNLDPKTYAVLQKIL